MYSTHSSNPPSESKISSKDSKKPLDKSRFPETSEEYEKWLASDKDLVTSYHSKLSQFSSFPSPELIELLKYEQRNIISLLKIFTNELQQYLVASNGETLNIISLGAGDIEELIPLIILAEKKGIKIHLWAIDNDESTINRVNSRYAPFQQYFTYLKCDATNLQAVKKAIEKAGGRFKGAAITMLRQPNVQGHSDELADEKPKVSADFHKMITETIPYVSAVNSIIFCSWFFKREVDITTNSMSKVQSGVYLPVLPVLRVKPMTKSTTFLAGGPKPLEDSFIAIYRCVGQAFARGKELRNLAFNDRVNADVFAREVDRILAIDPELLNESSPTTGYTALHHAAEKGNIEKINLLLDRKADVNAVSKASDTPLKILKSGVAYPAELLERLKPTLATAIKTDTNPAKLVMSTSTIFTELSSMPSKAPEETKPNKKVSSPTLRAT